MKSIVFLRSLLRFLAGLPCLFGRHRWTEAFMLERPHLVVRACEHCPRHQRRVGGWWCPCDEGGSFVLQPQR
jgi:hypothetical protein